MVFKDLRQGHSLYLLHKGKELKVVVGKVNAVSASRFLRSGNNCSFPAQTVVDITVDNEGVVETYPVPDTLSTAMVREDLLISIEREGFLKELEAIKTLNSEEISKYDIRKNTVERCDELLAEWNPEYKEKQANEERFTGIERSLTDMRNMVTDTRETLSELKTLLSNLVK